jgi:prepilin-type N-terminal cleavage/methylation domain-containing protein
LEKLRSRWSVIKRAQDGVTLVEVLVGVAITGMISTVVGSLLFATMTSSRRLQDQTDMYESLRLPAAMLTQDARFARTADCGWDYLKFYTSASPTDYIEYHFASWGGVADPVNVHRWVVQGGVMQRDDIVGWNLVQPDFSHATDATEFGCDTRATSRWASIRFVKTALPGQTVNTQLSTMAFLRSN